MPDNIKSFVTEVIESFAEMNTLPQAFASGGLQTKIDGLGVKSCSRKFLELNHGSSSYDGLNFDFIIQN